MVLEKNLDEKKEGRMVKFYKPLVIALALFIGLFITQPAFSAEEISEGMNQGDFAMLLIKELGAEGLLPPAATINDAFALLEELGAVPVDGWDAEDDIDKNDLAEMLGLSEEEAFGSFDDLLRKLKDRLTDILWTMGVNVQDRKTISPTGGGI